MIRTIIPAVCLTFLVVLPHGVALPQPVTQVTLAPLNINNHLYHISHALAAGIYESRYTGSTFPAREFRVAYVDDFTWGGYVTAGALRQLRIDGMRALQRMVLLR